MLTYVSNTYLKPNSTFLWLCACTLQVRDNLSSHFLATEIAPVLGLTNWKAGYWQWFGSDFPGFHSRRARTGNMWTFVKRTKRSAADDHQSSESSVSKETTPTTARVSTCAPAPVKISTAESWKKKNHESWEKCKKKCPIQMTFTPRNFFLGVNSPLVWKINPFTPELKKCILPAFQKAIVPVM